MNCSYSALGGDCCGGTAVPLTGKSYVEAARPVLGVRSYVEVVLGIGQLGSVTELRGPVGGHHEGRSKEELDHAVSISKCGGGRRDMTQSAMGQVPNGPGPTRVELFSRGRLIITVGGSTYRPAMVPRLNDIRGYDKPDAACLSGGPGIVYLYDNNTYQTNENWVGIRWPGGAPQWINLRENWVNQSSRNGIGLGPMAGAAAGVGSFMGAPEMAGGAVGGAFGFLPGGKIVSGDFDGRRDGYAFVFHRHANEPFGFTDNWKTDNISSVQVFPDVPRSQWPGPQLNGQAPQTPGNVAGRGYLPYVPLPRVPRR